MENVLDQPNNFYLDDFELCKIIWKKVIFYLWTFWMSLRHFRSSLGPFRLFFELYDNFLQTFWTYFGTFGDILEVFSPQILNCNIGPLFWARTFFNVFEIFEIHFGPFRNFVKHFCYLSDPILELYRPFRSFQSSYFELNFLIIMSRCKFICDRQNV